MKSFIVRPSTPSVSTVANGSKIIPGLMRDHITGVAACLHR